MGDVISSLIVEVGSETSGLTRGLDQADRQVQGFLGGISGGLKGLGSSVTGLGIKLTAMTAPLGIGLGAGIKIAADFESSLAEISARAGLTTDELQRVSDFALQMGADTVFSGQEAADAFLQLLTSGQNVNEAMATLPSILDAAAASGEELGHTADVITDIMAAFGLEVDQSGAVVDSLARAAGSSSATMGMLGDGFANVGGVAKAFGIDVNRTAAILAVLSENGVKGAEAGTALKSMLLNMTRTTEPVQSAWAALNTSFYDANGNARDLTLVLDDIRDGLKDMPVEKQNEVMRDLAGSYGIVALTALMGANSIEEMEAAMAGSADAATVAQARMDTFAGVMSSLMGSVEALAIRALTPFMNDVLKPIGEALIPIINRVSEWATNNPELTGTIVGIAAAAVVAGPALVVMGLGIQAAGVAIGALGAGLAILTSPLFLAAAGLVALGLGLAYVWTNDIGGIKTKIEELASAISSTDVSGKVDAFKTSVVTAFSDIGAIEVDASGLQSKLADAFTSVETLTFDTSGFKSKLAEAFTSVEGVTLDTSGISTWATDNANTIISVVGTAAGIVFGGPVALAIGAAKLVALAIENDFLGIGTFIQESGIQSSVETALTGLKTTLDGILQSVFSPSGGGATAGLGEIFHVGDASIEATGPLDLFISDLKRGIPVLESTLANVASSIAPGLQALGDGIKGFIDNISGTETEGLLRIATVIGGAIGGILLKVTEVGADLVGGILTNIGNALPAFGEAINGFVTGLSNLGEGNFLDGLLSIADGITAFVDAGLKLIGLDIDVPSLTEGLEGWQTGLQAAWDSLIIIGDGLRLTINKIFLDIQIAFDTWVNDLRQKIIDLTSNIPGVTQPVDIAPGVDIHLASLLEQRGGIDIAAQIQAELAAGLAAGSIDLSPELAGAIAWNPQAIAEGMSVNGRAAVQEALALSIAGGDTEAYEALLPLAAELDIDTGSLIDQTQAGIDLAASTGNYTATVGVEITLNPTFTNLPSVTSAINAAASGAASNTGAAMPAPPSSYGFLGESLLSAPASNTGQSERGTTVVNLTAYGQSPYDLYETLQRVAHERGQ